MSFNKTEIIKVAAALAFFTSTLFCYVGFLNWTMEGIFTHLGGEAALVWFLGIVLPLGMGLGFIWKEAAAFCLDWFELTESY